MKILKLLTLVMSSGILLWSCQTGPSETDNAYAEVVSQTDSIQMMNNNLKDTLQMVMDRNQQLMSAMDTAAQDSSNLATLARNQVIFDEKKASLDKIDQMTTDFESFEAEHDKGDMNDEDVKSQIDEIKRQQNDIFNQLDEIDSELNNIHRDQQNMMDRRNNDPMTDGEQMDNNAAATKN